MFSIVSKFEDNKFDVGESYHIECDVQGNVFLVSEHKMVEFSVIQLSDLDILYNQRVQKMNESSIMIENIILNDICKNARTVNFVVVKSSPKVVFSLQLLPLTNEKS